MPVSGDFCSFISRIEGKQGGRKQRTEGSTDSAERERQNSCVTAKQGLFYKHSNTKAKHMN